MRRALDRIYVASEYIAAGFIACICLTVLVQVSFNIVDKIAVWTIGEAVGLVLPSYAEFTGNFLAAATFFALAAALNNGSHIRVTLVISHLPATARHVAEVLCCVLGTACAAYFCYWTGYLVYESLIFGDVSPGIIAVPLWIPQLSMPLGLAVLFIAFLDNLLRKLKHGEALYEADKTGTAEG